MPQLIEIPGVGPVEFPDDMNDEAIAQAIKANYQFSDVTPEESLSRSLTAAGEAYRAGQDGPSAGGAFIREGARSVAPGIGGMMSGAATGAGLGAMGANPFTVGAGALIGGVAGGFGIRMTQDKIADELAPDSFMGTKSAGEDFNAHPVAALLGGAVAQGRPAPIRALGVGRNLLTSEGRGLIRAGLQAEAAPAARLALHDAIDVGTGAGVGAGMSLATGDGMAPESALLGTIFSRPYLNFNRMFHPAEAPQTPGTPPAEAQTRVTPQPRPVAPVVDVQATPVAEAPPVAPVVEAPPVAPVAEAPLRLPPETLPPYPGDIPQRPLPAEAPPTIPVVEAPPVAEVQPVATPEPVPAVEPSPAVKPVAERPPYVATPEEVERWSLNTPERIAENERWQADTYDRAQGPSTESPAEKQARWMARLEWVKQGKAAPETTASVVDAPPVPPVKAANEAAAPQVEAPPVPRLEGKQRTMAMGRKTRAEGQLAKLESSGKGETPQADKLRTRIAGLSEQIGEVGPSRRDRVRETLDSDEFKTISEIIRSGGMKPADKSVALLERARRGRARLSEESGKKLNAHANWEDGPRASQFDQTDGGQLAKAVVGRMYSNHPEARTPDKVAEHLGITVPEMWAKVHAEADSIARNNGVMANKAEVVMNRAEAERVRFEDAAAKYPNHEKAEAGELNKGDTFEMDGEPMRVLSTDGDTVKLRDGDRFGVQEVDAMDLIPMEKLKPAAQKEAPASAMDRKNADSKELFADDGGFALTQESTQDGDAVVKAREAKEAAKKAADDAQGKMDFDAPEERGGLLDGLKRHRDNVDRSIRQSPDLFMFTGLPNKAMAKVVYKLALDTTIKAIETGDSLRRAIRKGVAALRSHRLAKKTRAEIEARLAADVAAQIRFGRQRDGQMRVETSKLAQEFAAKGNMAPTKADFIRELSARFPDQDTYIRKNIDELFDGMMFDRATAAKDSSEWGEWARDLRDRVKDVLASGKESLVEKRLANTARAIHDTLFTGLGEKMHALADGKHTGRRSDSLKNFAREAFGLKAGEDGVRRVSMDVAAEADSNRMLNPLDDHARELGDYFRRNGVPRADRQAFKERITEHMVDPTRDGELSNQPELKKAVDFFLKRRKQRLDYMRSNMVDVGNVGPRSASRVMDPLRVSANRGEFVAKATEAYRAKWDAEIRTLRKEAAKLKARGKDGDAERYEKIQDKIKELQARDAKPFAEKYLYAIEAGERGVSSDGNDIFAAPTGDKADNIKSREFGPEADELLGKFMFRDAFDLDAYETTAAVRSVTRARMLSSRTKGGEIDRVGKWKKLRAEMEKEGNGDMVPMAAQLVKSYLNLGGSDNPIAQKALEYTHAFTQLAYLSRAGVSNLGEPVLIGLRSGRVGDMVKAYKATGRNLARRLRNMAPNESQILADALGIAKGGMNSLMGAARMQDAFGGRGKLGKIVSQFHVKTLLTDMTHAMHEASVEIGRGFIHAELRIAKGGGVTSRLSRKNLTEIGIGKGDIDRMVHFTEKLAKAPDKVAMILSNTPEARLYRDALTLFSRSGAVLDPTRGSRPQYANTPVGSLFHSLQSFLYEFHQKVTKRHASRLMAAARGKMQVEGKTETLTSAERGQIAKELMAGASAIYAAQFGVQMIREHVFSDPERVAKDKRRTDGEVLAQRMKATLSRTGIIGPYDLLFNMVTGARFQRDPATVVLGPAIGGFSEMFKAIVETTGDRNTTGTNTVERKLARTAYNMTVAPTIGALSATMPGRLIPGALIQGAYHPGVREAAVRGVAGPPKLPRKALQRKRD